MQLYWDVVALVDVGRAYDGQCVALRVVVFHVVQQVMYGCQCSQSMLHSLAKEGVMTMMKCSNKSLESYPNRA